MSKWEWKKLGEVCEIHGRIGWQGLTRKEYRSSGDYLLITGINFTDNNTVDYESCVYVDKERYVQDQYIQVRENDLLITKDGTLGKLALIAEMPPKPATLNGGLFVIRNPDNKIYPKFLMYVMKSEPFRKMIRKSITGSTVPHLTQNMLVNFPIPIPSLSEQRSIVKQLDEKLTKIEKIKTNAETNLKNAKELFETTLEKELNPQSRHSERSEESSAELPSGWEWKKLGEVYDFTRGLTYSKKDEVESSSNCILRSNNIDLQTNSINLDELKYIKDEIDIPQEKYVRKNTILICMSNGSKAHLGKVAYIDKDYDFAFGGFMGLLKPKCEINGKFVHLYLCSDEYKNFIKSLSDGANINNLKFDDLRKFEIPVPPLSVQKEIVARLDKLSENVKRLEANYKQITANCDELKKSILKQTFQGGN